MVAATSRRHILIRLDSATRAFVALRLAFLLRSFQRGFLRLLFRVFALRHGIPSLSVGPRWRNAAPGRTGLSNRIAREEIAAKLRVERDHTGAQREAPTNSPPLRSRSRFRSNPTAGEVTSRGANEWAMTIEFGGRDGNNALFDFFPRGRRELRTGRNRSGRVAGARHIPPPTVPSCGLGRGRVRKPRRHRRDRAPVRWSANAPTRSARRAATCPIARSDTDTMR